MGGKPRAAKPAKPAQCESKTKSGERCRRPGVVKVGGMLYCTTHVAMVRGQKLGRPKSEGKQRVEQIFKELGPPPEGDPVAAILWLFDAQNKALFLTMTGATDDRLLMQLRATATAMSKQIPAEQIIKRVLENSATPRKPKQVQREAGRKIETVELPGGAGESIRG